MEKVTYESICEKLGFDVDTYEVPESTTEDDNGDSPFRSLTLEELNFLTDRIENKKKECIFWEIMRKASFIGCFLIISCNTCIVIL